MRLASSSSRFRTNRLSSESTDGKTEFRAEGTILCAVDGNIEGSELILGFFDGIMDKEGSILGVVDGLSDGDRDKDGSLLIDGFVDGKSLGLREGWLDG